ncbi:hypothetical protein Salat_0272600 [Sesamum alatum]|uniref:Bifunctional inhibitor/plant lipid transfer protein/seed storage helical domain-containing protein n=1 Tax=Sesamum alatum TaxID=300844 RepID=A0AAE1Z005_9LAMI|nr:hypothetical protein Salat_0272600 [Sesamum alatum]
MTGSWSRWLVAVVFLALVVGRGTAEVQCSDAVSQLLPCEGFLLGGDTAPSAGCCVSVQSLANIAAASQSDRKALCQCFKDTAKTFPINLDNARQLPQLCHVNINVAIDPSVNCDSL